MKKKLLCLLLVLTFCINSIPVHASDLEYGNEVDELFLPALSVPVAQGFAYLMGTLGVLATSKVVYDNSDALQEWGEKEMEKFKLKCTALNIAGTLVDAWFDKLATGVIDKSSACWSAFKTWLNELRSGASAGTSDIPFDGVIKAGHTYTLTDAFDKPFKYWGSVNGSTVKGHEITSMTFTANYDGFLYVGRSGSSYNVKPNFLSSQYGTVGSVKMQTVSGPVELSLYVSNYSLNQVTTSGKTYYVTWIGVDDCTTSTIPYFGTNSVGTVLYTFLNGGVEVDIPSDYKVVGGVSDVGKSDIINVGNVSFPLGKDEVYIDFGNVATGSIAGALGGVHDGTLSWSDVITSTGVNVAEDDKVVDDDGVTETPVPDLGNISDYKLNLTNLFPFCLPFDFIDFISLLSAEPETPRFEYEMPLPAGKSYTFDIDLSPFDSVASLMRKMETLAFIIGLIFITREKMIRG